MRSLLALAGIMGLVAVGFGAFGAHAMGDRLTGEAGGWWETAGAYLLPHAVAVLAASRTEELRTAGWLWGVGGLIFAATLYAMGLGAPRWFGAITPIGGVLMLGGWTILVIKAVSGKR